MASLKRATEREKRAGVTHVQTVPPPFEVFPHPNQPSKSAAFFSFSFKFFYRKLLPERLLGKAFVFVKSERLREREKKSEIERESEGKRDGQTDRQLGHGYNE